MHRSMYPFCLYSFPGFSLTVSQLLLFKLSSRFLFAAYCEASAPFLQLVLLPNSKWPSLQLKGLLLAGNHQIQNMNVRNGSSLVSREEKEREIQMSSDDHNH